VTQWKLFGAALALLIAGGSLQAGNRELATVDAATETVQALGGVALRGIPPWLMKDASAVAVLPNVVKAGFFVDGRFGRGVLLLRQPDGSWSNPIFLTLAGGGVGFQAGIESTDVVLVFKTRASVDRLLRGQGKLTLGGDVALAIGPVGREATAATDAQLKAEIYSYSRSRGLFLGVSLQGAVLHVNFNANEAFYGIGGGCPADVLALCGTPAVAATACLKAELANLSRCDPAPTLLPPVPAPILPPPQPPPLPPQPVPLPPPGR
jgi:lipid-binding SYLF domain-containing protein